MTSTPDHADRRRGPPADGQVRAGIGRRAFLQAAGISAAGMALGAVARGGQLPAGVIGTGSAALAADADPIRALAATLDFDLEKILRHVSDDIAYEPYAGRLRGARGALLGGAANSADKAVLLAALLDVAQIPYRFVRGPLDDAAAAALIASARLDGPSAKGLAEAALNARGGVLPRSGVALPAPAVSPVPDADTERIARSIKEGAPALTDAAAAQLDVAVAEIGRVLAAAGIGITSTDASLPMLERDQHVWVQAGLGPEWVDLDATLPGAQQGQLLATAAGEPTDVLPDELRHRVEFAVVAEQVSGGQLVQSTIHQLEAWADEIGGAPILFFNARAEDLSAIGVAISGLLDGTTQYYPALLVGDVSASGDIPLAFTTGDGGPFADAGSAEGETTAEWLEVRVTRPGEAPSVARRVVFDRIGADARAGGAIDLAAIPPVELVDIPGVGKEYLPAVTVHALAVATGPISGAAFQPAAAAGASDVSLVARAHHYLRDAINAELGLSRGVRIVVDGPTVASFTLEPGPMAADGPLLRTSIDLLHRSLMTLPVEGTVPTADPGLVAGVLSHVAERLTMGDGVSVGGRTPLPAVSVGAIFDAARASGIALRVLAEPAIPDDLDAPPPVRTALAAALDEGLVVVIPEHPLDIDGTARLGWWLIDPATGRTVDQLDDGRGAVLPGYARLQAMAVRWGPAFFVLATCVAKFGQVAAIIIGAVGSSEAASIAAETAQAASESGAGEGC